MPFKRPLKRNFLDLPLNAMQVNYFIDLYYIMLMATPKLFMDEGNTNAKRDTFYRS